MTTALSPEDGLARAREAGIHRLSVPTPFAVGRVNCYLLEDEPLTLIDTGPNSGKALDELNTQLGALGHSIDDIELVIVTHQHIDHLGLVEIIAEHSGAEVAAIDVSVDRLANFAEDAERDDEFAGELMLQSGIPADVVVALQSVSRSFRAWGSKAIVTRPLHEGETMEFRDRRLEVFHRPGHSPSDTIFWDADRKLLIGADHLIAHISSNPLVTRPLDGSGDRTQALVTYMDSLAKTREMPIDVILPGHGEPITNHIELIDKRMAMHHRRKEKIARLLAQGPKSGYEIAQSLWGNVAVTQAYLTLSEVIGHTDLLVNEGRVQEVESGGVIRFEVIG